MSPSLTTSGLITSLSSRLDTCNACKALLMFSLLVQACSATACIAEPILALTKLIMSTVLSEPLCSSIRTKALVGLSKAVALITLSRLS